MRFILKFFMYYFIIATSIMVMAAIAAILSN